MDHPEMSWPSPTTAISLQRPSSSSVALLQLGLMLADEGADLVTQVEQLDPLLLVQGDREATEAVDRETALLADLHRGRARASGLERLVLRLQPLQLRTELVVGGHGVHSTPPQGSEAISLRNSVSSKTRRVSVRTFPSAPMVSTNFAAVSSFGASRVRM